MKNLALLPALLVLACGAAPDLTLQFSPPELPPTEAPPELQDALLQAGFDWIDAGLEPSELPYIAKVAWAPRESINATCGYPEGVPLLGCSHGPLLWLREGLLEDRRFPGVMRHELGHSIRTAAGGPGGHLECDAMPGDALMCNGGSADNEVTERDLAFVRGEL